MRSHLLEGQVRHRRVRPVEYALAHDVYYVALDLAELDEVARSIRLVGRNRRNVLEFRDADHWPAPATDIRATVLGHLRVQGEDPTGWRITLVTNLRVLGYVFNPASFYLCRDAAGALARRGRGGAQHARGAPPVHAPTAGARAALRGLHGQGLLRVAVHRHGGPLHRARADDPASLRIAIDERQGDAPVIATSLVLEAPAPDRPDGAADARCPSAGDPADDGAHPLSTRGGCGAGACGSSATARRSRRPRLASPARRTRSARRRPLARSRRVAA